MTAANVHDSKVAVRLLKRTTKVGELAWEDAGYVGTEDELRANGIVPIVCEKGYRGHPLTEKKKKNKEKINHYLDYLVIKQANKKIR